jgi:hypothetical protein
MPIQLSIWKVPPMLSTFYPENFDSINLKRNVETKTASCFAEALP